MKMIKQVFIGIAAFIAVCAVGLCIRALIPSQAAIAITGQPGQVFTGIIRSDGRAFQVSGIVPTNFVVTGRSVECRFQKPKAAGEFGVDMRVRSLGLSCSIFTPKSATKMSGVCTYFSFLNCGAYSF
jgi:hypothetical protein